LQIAREMSAHGITIFSVACEPALSGYRYAVDFFTAIAKMTGGMMLPLTSATMLPDVVIGGAREQLDLERRLEELRLEAEKYQQEKGEDVDETEMLRHLHNRMVDRGEKTVQLQLENPYEASKESEDNVLAMMATESLSTASAQFKKVKGGRLQAKFAYSSIEPDYLRSSRAKIAEPPVIMSKRRSFFGFGGGSSVSRAAPTRSSTVEQEDQEEDKGADDPEKLIPEPQTISEYQSQQVNITTADISEEQVFRMYSRLKSTAPSKAV
ncbi:hypothetical protein HK098_004715, partial [Nowakowskiella sp. JEL0407]